MESQLHPVTFSARALEEIRKTMTDQQLGSEYALRVAVGGSGCSGGIAPVLGFDKRKETDMVYTLSGVTIVVDKRHLLHLIGKHVEYHEVEEVSGFHFADAPLPKP
jgi:iron-sulfur cluster assembly protein